MSFQISPEVDRNKVFLVRSSEIEGRLDPAYNLALIRNKISSCFKKKKMGGLCKSLGGGTPSKGNLAFWTGSIPWVSPKDMKTFYLSETIDHISENAVAESSTNIVPKNSVLIVFRSGILQHTIPVAVTTKKMAINQDIKALIFKEKVIPSYAGYFFDVYQSKLLPLLVKHSTTVQSINTAQFDSLEIPVPPLEIQSAIVAKMDAAYAAKKDNEAKAQRLLNSIDDYLLGELGIELPEQEENTVQSRIFTRRFSEISGGRFDPYCYKSIYKKNLEQISQGKYPVKKIGELAFDLKNGVEMRTYSETGYRYLRVTDLGNHSINDHSPRYVITDEIPSKIKLDKDCILISRSGSLGLVNVVESKIIDAILSSHIFKVKLNCSCIIPEYAVNFLRSKSGQLEIFKRNNGGVIPEINQTALKKIVIPLPPLSKQTELSDHITQIRNKAKQLRQEGKQGLEQAKQEVEAMILGEDSSTA